MCSSGSYIYCIYDKPFLMAGNPSIWLEGPFSKIPAVAIGGQGGWFVLKICFERHRYIEYRIFDSSVEG